SVLRRAVLVMDRQRVPVDEHANRRRDVAATVVRAGYLDRKSGCKRSQNGLDAPLEAARRFEQRRDRAAKPRSIIEVAAKIFGPHHEWSSVQSSFECRDHGAGHAVETGTEMGDDFGHPCRCEYPPDDGAHVLPPEDRIEQMRMAMDVRN